MKSDLYMMLVETIPVSYFITPIGLYMLCVSPVVARQRLERKLYSGNEYTPNNNGCLKKRFTTLKAYINVFRGHVQCFELSLSSKTFQVIPGVVTVQCVFLW
jgi:hypothetical protein